MPETKFTPGPWKADVRLGCVAVYPYTSEIRCLSDASKWAIHYQEGYYTQPENDDGFWDIEPQKKANAYLIAAAPDMYEALASIENDDGHIPESIWQMRNQALAKARGEA